MPSDTASAIPFATVAHPPTVTPPGLRAAPSASKFAVLVDRVEECLGAVQRINDQMTALAEQRRKLHDELRGIQHTLNDEFDRILKPGAAVTASNGTKPTKPVIRDVDGQAAALRLEVAASRVAS